MRKSPEKSELREKIAKISVRFCFFHRTFGVQGSVCTSGPGSVDPRAYEGLPVAHKPKNFPHRRKKIFFLLSQLDFDDIPCELWLLFRSWRVTETDCEYVRTTHNFCPAAREFSSGSLVEISRFQIFKLFFSLWFEQKNRKT